MPRTVYIVGAGFSYPGGIPVQAGLLERIQDLGIMDAPRSVADQYFEAQSIALDFIKAISRSSVVPPLEDAFTLLDQTIATRGFCLGYTWQELVVVRERLQQALLVVLHSACSSLQKPEFYEDVATYLLARATGDVGDRASVLSLNWDSVIEDATYRVVRSLTAEGALDVNFGCGTQPLSDPSAHSPSMTQDARGVGNLELLKLHGSINWLLCPNCQALFSGAGISESAWDLYFGGASCLSCTPTLPVNAARPAPRLQPFLITPTFLKVMDSIHIQTTWQRAYYALARADEIVFLGYSLPLADFHVRALLRRALPSTVAVTAVLTAADEITPDTPAAALGHLAATRYRDFFGPAVTIVTRGAEAYFLDILAANPRERSLDALRARLPAASP